MFKKNSILLSILILTISVFSGCSANANVETVHKKAVKVTKLKLVDKENYLHYIGTIDSKDLVKYGFKSSGKIKNIYVKKGDTIKKGQALAKLDLVDLSLQAQGSLAKLNAAKADLKKANEALNYISNYYNDMENLHKNGAISDDSFDKVKLEYENTKETYNKAKEQINGLEADYTFKNNLLKDGTIYSTVNGTVVETPFKEGELIQTGYPCIVVRSKTQVINVGLSQKDVDNIKIGTKAKILINDEKCEGIVTNIAQAPDKSTRTYNAEVQIKDKSFRLGMIGKVDFYMGNKKGIWIPISSLMSDGQNYVYVINDNRALKRTVLIGDSYENLVEIKEGLDEKDLLVIEGMKNLKDGYSVNISEN